jgi:hypothetical protein
MKVLVSFYEDREEEKEEEEEEEENIEVREEGERMCFCLRAEGFKHFFCVLKLSFILLVLTCFI